MGNEKSVYSNRADQAEMFFALVTDDIAERPLSLRKLKEGHGLGSSSGSKKLSGKADRYPEEDADVEKGKWRFVGAYDAAVYNYRYGKVIPWSDAVGKQYLTIRLQGAFKKVNRLSGYNVWLVKVAGTLASLHLEPMGPNRDGLGVSLRAQCRSHIRVARGQTQMP